MALVKLLFKCCCRNACENEQKHCEKGENSGEIQDETLQYLKACNDNSIRTTSLSQLDRIKNSPKLQIKILESSVLETGSLIKINCAGMENSKRGKFDGRCFFGSRLEDNKIVVNDVVVREEDKGFAKQHFVIKYEEEKQAYYISDLGSGSGTFMRIDSEKLLKNGNIVSFGNTHMAVYCSSQM